MILGTAESERDGTPGEVRPPGAAPMKLADSVGEARPAGTVGGCSRGAALETFPRTGRGGTATAAKSVGEARPRNALRHAAMDRVADGDLTKKGKTRLDGEAGSTGTAQREPETESESDETPDEARPSGAAPSDTINSRPEIADSVGEAWPSGTRGGCPRRAVLGAWTWWHCRSCTNSCKARG